MTFSVAERSLRRQQISSPPTSRTPLSGPGLEGKGWQLQAVHGWRLFKPLRTHFRPLTIGTSSQYDRDFTAVTTL